MSQPDTKESSASVTSTEPKDTGESVETVSVKLLPFYQENPVGWFLQAEA